MPKIICFNKPFNVLTQFTDAEGRSTLANYLHHKNVYPAGRLDYDSEGLLLLTDSGPLQHLISHPHNKMPKTYWVQVEGVITDQDLAPLRSGVVLNDGLTQKALARTMEAPSLWERHPPIRHRKNQPTSWLEITIKEGRNRQVRRMTAAIGFPTLRLIRYAIGPWQLNGLQPGEWHFAEIPEVVLRDLEKPSRPAPQKRKVSTKRLQKTPTRR